MNNQRPWIISGGHWGSKDQQTAFKELAFKELAFKELAFKELDLKNWI